MKKICIFSAQYLPKIGGVERYTYYIAKGLINRGYSVTVVTSDVYHLGKYEKTEEDIHIYRLPCINLLGDRYPVLNKNHIFKQIDRQLRNAHFDFIVVNTRFYFHSLYGARLAYEEAIPCITIEHGTSHLSVNNSVADRLGQIWEHRITEKLKQYCRDYYGVSQAACDWTGHFDIVSKGTLYNAIDIKEILTLLDHVPCDYRNDLNIPQNAVIIVYTGRLIPEKGVIQLQQAFNRLGDTNAYLIYAGDGPCTPQLEAAKNDHTFFLGRIDFSHVIALLKTADIFCLPSVSEGFSTSALEAAATHTLIITTQNGGTKELVSDPDYGIVIKNNTTNEIKSALTKAIDDPVYRQSATDRCYQKLIHRFTFDNTVEKLIRIIENSPLLLKEASN